MRKPKPIQPSALFKALRGVLPKDTMYTVDAGTLCLQATDQLEYHLPPALFSPLDFGLVGFSYACGLGVKDLTTVAGAPKRHINVIFSAAATSAQTCQTLLTTRLHSCSARKATGSIASGTSSTSWATP